MSAIDTLPANPDTPGTTGAANAATGIAKFNVVLEDKIALYNAYMPYIKNGGIFIATSVQNSQYKIQQKVFVCIRIANRTPIEFVGTVVWISPDGNSARVAGIGVEFANDQDTQDAKKNIEELLGKALHSNRATHIL